VNSEIRRPEKTAALIIQNSNAGRKEMHAVADISICAVRDLSIFSDSGE